MEIADRVSQRRQSANSFYLAVNTAIIGGVIYLSQPAIGQLGISAISVAGIAICILWIRILDSYKSLNAAKFEVIIDLEKRLSASPYKDEWAILDVDGDNKGHKPFYKTEKLVPIVFIFVHIVLFVLHIPWRRIASLFSTLT